MTHLAVMPGSLRRHSFNRGVAEACLSLAPCPSQLVLPDHLPLFSQDYEIKGQEPDCTPARELRQSLRQADGVVIATPEYDGYPSGVIVNALNWCSRPPEWPLNHKPVMVVSTSPSPRAGRRAQHHIREILGAMGAQLFEPALCLDASEGFTEQGIPDSQAITASLEQSLLSFVAFVDAARQAG